MKPNPTTWCRLYLWIRTMWVCFPNQFERNLRLNVRIRFLVPLRHPGELEKSCRTRSILSSRKTSFPRHLRICPCCSGRSRDCTCQTATSTRCNKTGHKVKNVPWYHWQTLRDTNGNLHFYCDIILGHAVAASHILCQSQQLKGTLFKSRLPHCKKAAWGNKHYWSNYHRLFVCALAK